MDKILSKHKKRGKTLVSELGVSFHWLFVVKTVIFVLVTGFTVYLAKMIMDKPKEKKEGDKNKTK